MFYVAFGDVGFKFNCAVFDIVTGIRRGTEVTLFDMMVIYYDFARLDIPFVFFVCHRTLQFDPRIFLIQIIQKFAFVFVIKLSINLPSYL